MAISPVISPNPELLLLVIYRMSDISLVEQVQTILNRPLTYIEALVVLYAWEGLSYRAMAIRVGYGEEYLKQVGSKLWAQLSNHFGVTISKKNLRLALAENLRNWEVPPATVAQFSASPRFQEITPYAFPSGPLPPDSNLYIHRPPVEAVAFSEIDQPGCLLCIHAPHRYGKTSLLWRIMAYAQAQQYRACLLDLQEADSQTLHRADRLLPWICHRLGQGLGLEPQDDGHWDPHRGTKVNCGQYLQEVVLDQADTPLVVAIHALEMGLERATVAHDLLSMLRLWYEQAQNHPLWRRLRLVLVYASDSPTALTTPSRPSLLASVSPLNLGRALSLQPLNLDQFVALGRRYHLATFHDPSRRFAVEDLYGLIGGHPYLAHLSCYALKHGRQTLGEMVAAAATPTSVFWPHLQERLARLQHYPKAREALSQVVTGNGVMVDGLTLDQLISLGLVRVADGLVYPLGDLYRRFFATYSVGQNA